MAWSADLWRWSSGKSGAAEMPCSSSWDVRKPVSFNGRLAGHDARASRPAVWRNECDLWQQLVQDSRSSRRGSWSESDISFEVQHSVSRDSLADWTYAELHFRDQWKNSILHTIRKLNWNKQLSFWKHCRSPDNFSQANTQKIRNTHRGLWVAATKPACSVRLNFSPVRVSLSLSTVSTWLPT